MAAFLKVETNDRLDSFWFIWKLDRCDGFGWTKIIQRCVGDWLI